MKERVGLEFPVESDIKQEKTVQTGGIPVQAVDPRAEKKRPAWQGG